MWGLSVSVKPGSGCGGLVMGVWGVGMVEAVGKHGSGDACGWVEG